MESPGFDLFVTAANLAALWRKFDVLVNQADGAMIPIDRPGQPGYSFRRIVNGNRKLGSVQQWR
jgi:hypothetical protein